MRNGRHTRRRARALTGVLAAAAMASLALVPHQASADEAADRRISGAPAGLAGVGPRGQILNSPQVPGNDDLPASFAGTGDIADAGPNVSFDETPPAVPPADVADAGTAQDEGATVSPLLIVGADNRQWNSSTTQNPNRMVGYLSSSGGSCSGSLVGPDVVLTAGHCMHPGGTGDVSGDMYSDFRFWPGINGNDVQPYGSCGVSGRWISLGWVNNASWGSDWGLLKLNCDIGNTTGWLGWWPRSTWIGFERNPALRGYHDDKPAFTQWRQFGPIRREDSDQLFYDMDTYYGSSGSPVMMNNDEGNWFVIGVNNVQFAGTTHPNAAVRMTASLVEQIQYVRSW